MGEMLNYVVIDPVKAMFIQLWKYVPAVAGAIVILVVGWVAAKFIEAVVVRVLKTVKLDDLCDKAGVSNVLAKGEVKITLSEILGAIVYWVIALVAIATALGTLNLPIAADVVSRLIDYVPNVLGAIFILILGTLLADFVGAVVRTTAGNAGVKKAAMLANVTKTILVILAIGIAIEQLKIAQAFIGMLVSAFQIAMIGAALAFGLGCKDIAGKFAQDIINDMKK